MQYDVTIQTIAWINSRRNDETLEISPQWQRRPVWLERERSSLMETIMLNLPFPEIYIKVDTVSDSGAQKYVVVDGQQRITSILKFLDGEVPLPDTPQWEGRVFRDLRQEEKQHIWGYKVVIRMLSAVSEADIRDLFMRLNTNNISLNEQELRNARFMGRFKQTAERLADNPFFQSIRLFTAREIRRMEDVEFVSELLLLVVEGITNKKDLLDQIYAEYDEEFPREAEFEEDFNRAMQLIVNLTNENNATLVKTKSNFFSLFGACLRYWRENHRSSFLNAQQAQAAVTDLLSQAKNFDPSNAQGASEPVKSYYDAVSRAASDKARRAKREEILFSLLRSN